MTEASHAAPPGLAGLVADLHAIAEGQDKIPLRDLLTTLGARGHGPIILVLAGLMLLPTGMLPGMPAAIGVLLMLTATQMIVGGKGVSLPTFIAKINIPSGPFRAALVRVDPMCKRISRVLHPRWNGFAQNSVTLLLIALILLAASAVMIVIGAIPGLPFILCIPALLFGLGLTAGDGAVVAVGLVTSLGAGYGVTRLAPQILGWVLGG